ncbi:ATP-binding protein [Streptomyces sp. NPDC026294]|uniref:ATP-binding protein n=1 Tax=Streptomyces sp. NPDC026294 TaxID=3155362 RepID=UPI003402DAC9
MTTNRFTHQQRARRNALADAAASLPAALLPTYSAEGLPRQRRGVITNSTASLRVRPWAERGNPLHAARQMGRTRAAELSPNEDFLSAAELVVSELVSNAVRYSAGAVWVHFPPDPCSFMVRVLDESPQVPHECNATTDEVRGRGLFLVRVTAAEYGGEYAVDGDERGKSVGCRLPAPFSRRQEKTA